MDRTTARAVRFDRYGDRDVLDIRDIPMPRPGADEVLVEVRAAGINPGETNIRTGALHDRFPASFPSGQGSDLAGVVVELGSGVTGFVVGDEVLGFSWARSSHATHSTVPTAQLIPKPPTLPWEVAGSLYVAACTAYAAVRAVAARPAETVAVSAASGGVGNLVVQLLVLQQVHVLGIASRASDDVLTRLGAVPVHHGQGLAKRLSAAAPSGIDGFIDLFGPEYVHVAVDLGIPPQRIETVIAFDAARELGTKAEGSATASTTAVLTEMADLLASEAIRQPIEATYPLDGVRDAFELLEQRHSHGKIVLVN